MEAVKSCVPLPAHYSTKQDDSYRDESGASLDMIIDSVLIPKQDSFEKP